MRQGEAQHGGTFGSLLGLNRPLKGKGIAAAVVAFALLVAAPIAQGAEASRQLDPVLSLIGGCETPEALDPIEDPGCPGGTHPASGAFAVPMAVTTDFYGNIYVSNFGKLANGSQGRIDIFDPEGLFISELKIPAPTSVAVDSKGNLYVVQEIESLKPILRYEPSVYKPEDGEIEYPNVSTPLPMPGATKSALYTGIAINPENDHLFGNFGTEGVLEYDSAEGGNDILRKNAMPIYPYGMGVAVDASRHLLYATAEEERIEIFDLTETVGSPGEEEYKNVGSIGPSAVPANDIGGHLSLAVDEATGHIFMLDGEANVVYEFEADGTYVATIEHGFNVSTGAEIGLDNGPFSPNGALNDGDNGRYLYVPSGKTGTGHSYAFEESSTRAPDVKSTDVAGITDNEAELQASVNSGNLATDFTFEYTTEESFVEEGFAGAAVAGAGQLPAGNLDDEAFAAATGLQPGTQYRFRIIATNAEGSDELEGNFSTYPQPLTDASPCDNEELRAGFSALLPDCRAYELVSPADTNGRAPLGIGHEGYFTGRQVSPDGNKVPFRVEGGSIPGIGGTGSYLGDPYVSSRGADGWSTVYTGPSGAEAATVMPGGTSPDQGYSFFHAEREGSLVIDAGALNPSTSYLRYPDGHVALLGVGSIDTDPEATGFLISGNGSHVIFGTGYGATPTTAVQLEPDAAPSGTRAIYDRTPDGVTHVVSLLPGNSPIAITGEHAGYEGASLDGEGIVFAVGSTLYLRYQNNETYELGTNVEFAGVAEGGNRAFYLEGGRLWRFDALNGERTPFSSGTVTPVNVSSDGSAAYFISTAKLTAADEPNPNGATPKLGKRNLYLSKEGAISFVGTVTDRDVEGQFNGKEQVDGLGLWADAAASPVAGAFGIDPSRTTPDGSVLLFQSRAPLAGYNPDGYAEVYLFDSVNGGLRCLSCSPIGAAATADATLQSENREGFALFFPQAWIENLRADGRRAIFQSMEALVPSDTDGLQDVYEWEGQGVGNCRSSEGCLFLLSSGSSLRNEYLWAVSPSGEDVFFLSSNRLLPADLDETPSIYDARVGGGFSEVSGAECQGEGCRPQLSPAPSLPGAQTPLHGVGDNFKPRRHKCPQGKPKVKQAGKVRCVKKHKKHSRHRAGSDKKGARK
jgi:hypothetical protein